MIRENKGHNELVEGIIVFKNETFILTVSDDRTAKVWTLDVIIPLYNTYKNL
jgi:hypothetical protein